MTSLKTNITELLKKHIPEDVVIEVTAPEGETFGHYSTTVAFSLASMRKKAPLVIAEELRNNLIKNISPLFAQIEVATPGFINFWINDAYFYEVMREAVQEGNMWGDHNVGNQKTIIVEYFQLNVAKVPHVGHLRSAVIGDSLKRIALALQYHAVSDTHVGDWGTQFGILLYGYRLLDNETRAKIAEDPFEALNALYIKTNQDIEEDPELREKAKQEFALLEQGDSERRTMWKWMVAMSMKKLEESALRLGLLPFDEHKGESAYEKDMPDIVELALKKKVAIQNPDGAVIVDLHHEGLDEAVLIKSDGASTYLLRDLATIQYRRTHYDFWKNMYVVDVRQTHHFHQVFRVAELLGIKGEGESVHVVCGFMSLPEGQMSSRKGTTIHLHTLLDDLVSRAREVIMQKNPEIKNPDMVAHSVALGALKYFDLSHHRKSNIIFHKDEALSFEGSTGPYLQYTHARFASILRKAGEWHEDVYNNVTMRAEEKLLAACITRFPDILEHVLEECAPHILAQYLFELAQRANSFYHASPVNQEENITLRTMRILLVRATKITLARGLYLLGIEAPEEM